MTDRPSHPEDTHADDPEPRGARDAALVAALRAADTDAFGRLYDLWFDRVHDLAFRILHDVDLAADVAQDAFLSAWRNIDTLHDDHAFGGWLLRIARNGALNRRRKEQRVRPVDTEQLAVIERTQRRPEDLIGSVDDPLRVAEDTAMATMVWEAADALGERDRDVLDLQLRHGLTPNDVADVVGLNRNAANQLVHRVRQRLGTAVSARTLWRDGAPECRRLRAELATSHVDTFDGDAVRIIERHANACDVCDERRQRRVSPAAMFSALPVISLPALKAKVAAALAADGVPMQGSEELRPPDNGPGPTAGDDEPAASRRPHRRRLRIVVAAAAAVAVIALATVATAERLGDNSVELVRETLPEINTTSAPAPITTNAPLPTPIAPTTLAPAVVAPPPVATTAPRATTPTTSPPPPAPPTITFTITPNRMPPLFPTSSAPTLAWTVTGAAGVSVSGPAGFSASTPSGSAQVCPAPSAGNTCSPQIGNYTYTLQARDAQGTLLDTRTVTLTTG
jgi:RNA polymerase sigma factor (sigma-70 family)